MRVEPYGPPYEPKAVTRNPDEPVYLVTFWRALWTSADTPEIQRNYESDERIVREVANVTEVIDWAKENAGPDRTYEIHVASIDVDGDSDMIHLYGNNPTRKYFPDSEPFRRTTPADLAAWSDIFLLP